MVISQTAKVGASVVNYKLPRLYIKANFYCRQLIGFGAMSTSVSRAQVVLARIGAAIRHATAQLIQGGRRRRGVECAAHLRMMQLLCREQCTRTARLPAVSLRAACIKLR